VKISPEDGAEGSTVTGAWGGSRMTHIHISLCGRTTVTDDHGRVRLIAGVKPIRILEMLALQQGESLSKDVIADRLWDGRPPRSWVGTLESHISTLRRDIGCVGRSSALTTTAQGYVLTDAGVTVDVVELRRLLQAAGRADDRSRAALVIQAPDLRQGALLAGNMYSLWAEQARAEVDTLLLEACTEAARASYRLGDNATARSLAQRAIELDECAEGAWHVVLESLESDGRTGEALTAYGRLRAVMLDRIGIEPSIATRAVYARLLAHDAAATDAGGGDTDRAELRGLLRLLRQRLEGWPGVVVPEQDSRLAEIAANILAVA
jgi:DNA-binding SARP family transcriptional activator